MRNSIQPCTALVHGQTKVWYIKILLTSYTPCCQQISLHTNTPPPNGFLWTYSTPNKGREPFNLLNGEGGYPHKFMLCIKTRCHKLKVQVYKAKSSCCTICNLYQSRLHIIGRLRTAVSLLSQIWKMAPSALVISEERFTSSPALSKIRKRKSFYTVLNEEMSSNQCLSKTHGEVFHRDLVGKSLLTLF